MVDNLILKKKANKKEITKLVIDEEDEDDDDIEDKVYGNKSKENCYNKCFKMCKYKHKGKKHNCQD